MNRKWTTALVLVLVIGFVIGGWLYRQEPKKDEAVSDYFTKSPIVYIGNGEPGFPVVKQQFGEKIKDQGRFILIDDTLKLTPQHQEQIQEWIDEKRVVLFYGDDIDEKTFSKRIGKDIDTTVTQSNIEQYFTLLGYGYSFKFQKNMLLFLSSNSPGLSANTVQQYLFEQYDAF